MIVHDATPSLCKHGPVGALTVLLSTESAEQFEGVDHDVKLGPLLPPEIRAMAEAFGPGTADTVEKACAGLHRPIAAACLRRFLCTSQLRRQDGESPAVDVDQLRTLALREGAGRHQHLYS